MCNMHYITKAPVTIPLHTFKYIKFITACHAFFTMQ